MVPVMLILLTVIFLLLHVLPGDPARVLLGSEASEQNVEALRHELGLDRPLYIQYFDYLSKMFRGDLGKSLFTGTSVNLEISQAFPTTLELSIAGIILAALMGIPAGIVSALKRNKVADHVIRIFALGSSSVPIFWVAMMLQLLFAVILGILPVAGRIAIGLQPPRVTGMYVLDSILTLKVRALSSALVHLALPTLAMGIFLFPMISRISRANMIDTLSEDYITTARAKGLSANAVIYKHAFRNALLPTVTIIGMQFAFCLGGSVLIESIFNFPGLGSLLVKGAFDRDFELVQGIIVVYSLLVIGVNTVIDIVYAALDPRIRF